MYEIIWFFFMMVMGILLSIGLFGLLLNPSIPGRISRDIAFLLSVLILAGAIYCSYKWFSVHHETRKIAQQGEKFIKCGGARNDKKEVATQSHRGESLHC